MITENENRHYVCSMTLLLVVMDGAEESPQLRDLVGTNFYVVTAPDSLGSLISCVTACTGVRGRSLLVDCMIGRACRST